MNLVPEAAGVGAEILERVERAAPEDAASEQRHGDRAKVGEEEERDGEWVSHDIRGPDARDLEAGDVEAGDGGELDQGGCACPSTGPERGQGQNELNQETEAGEECDWKTEAVEGEEIFLQIADDAPGSAGPAYSSKTGTEDDALAVASSLELPAYAHVFDDFHGKRIEAADALIARAPYEVKGANSKKIFALWVGYSPEADPPDGESVHRSVHGSLARGSHSPVGHEDEMVGLVRDGVAQR